MTSNEKIDSLVNEFYIRLLIKLFKSFNNYYIDNYDYLRFGKLTRFQIIKEFIKSLLFKYFFIQKSKFESYAVVTNEILSINNYGIDWLYEHLDDNESKQLLIDLIAYRILGHRYIKLRVNENEYWDLIKMVDNLAYRNQSIPLKFLNWNLRLFHLSKSGYDIKIFSTISGVSSTFMLDQYSYKSDLKIIEANRGDNVIDAGGCWGDTSLYFATKVGEMGRIYSFEFIPANLEIFEKNISLNPHINHNVTLVKQPLWNISGKKIFYIDNGPGSKVSFNAIENPDGEIETITIDKYVEDNKIGKIDFIKMDIEGAELFALKGASNTIRQFNPKLAIAIYHSLDDFTEIPRWIYELNLGYKLFLGHYSIHSEETILFATKEKN